MPEPVSPPREATLTAACQLEAPEWWEKEVPALSLREARGLGEASPEGVAAPAPHLEVREWWEQEEPALPARDPEESSPEEVAPAVTASTLVAPAQDALPATSLATLMSRAQ